MKVKKHSIGPDGKIKVQVQLDGEKACWMGVEEFWTTSNIALYVPAWREYCNKKALPLNWRDASGTPNEEGVVDDVPRQMVDDGPRQLAQGGEVLTQLSQTEPVPADCCNHVLDSRGLVYMELRWKDDGTVSRALVRGVMKV